MSLKNLIRQNTVAKKIDLKSKVVTFNEGKKDEYKVKFTQPNRKIKKELYEKCVDENGLVQLADLQNWAVIYLTVDPETDERVFGEGDYELLSNQASDSWVDEYAEHALGLVSGLDGEPNDPKESQPE